MFIVHQMYIKPRPPESFSRKAFQERADLTDLKVDLHSPVLQKLKSLFMNIYIFSQRSFTLNTQKK